MIPCSQSVAMCYQLQGALEQTIVGAGGWGHMSGVTNCN